jgi:hypothetical protein
VDPASNGNLGFRRNRPSGPSAGRPADRGRWIIMIAVVSAMTGACLLLGGFLGLIADRALHAPALVVVLLIAVGALVGVWLGARFAIRLTGGDHRRFVASGLGGSVGLVGAVAVAYTASNVLPALLPFVAILCPGFGAAIGALVSEQLGQADQPRSP